MLITYSLLLYPSRSRCDLLANLIYIALFVGYQTTSIFSGMYKKAYFAFERRFHKDGSLVSTQPTQRLAYIEPAIPPESPPESNLIDVNEQAGGVSATIRNLFGRFRRTDSNSDLTSNTNIAMEPLQSIDETSKRISRPFKMTTYT